MSIDVYDAIIAGVDLDTVLAPDAAALTGNLRESVHRTLEGEQPENTLKAMNPKMREFLCFCKQIYPNRGNPTILSADNVYRFMFYQAFREKKPRGKKETDSPFNLEAYKKVMESYSNPGIVTTVEAAPQPEKPIGESTFALYKATLKRVYCIQKTKQHLGLQWDDIWTDYCKSIHKIVKKRAPAKKKENYEEKVNGDIAPYLM
ncbi:MAG: hypothetical protein SGARI_000093, partial [Bacillariaceae sp.]